MNIYRSWRPPVLPGEASNGVWEQWIAPSRGAFYSQFRRRYPESRVRIVGISRLQTQRRIRLQMGRPYNSITLRSVEARKIRRSRSGGLEAECFWQGRWQPCYRSILWGQCHEEWSLL